MKQCIVYGLYSSRDDELRYIGQTTQPLKKRLSQHINYSKTKRTAVHKWIYREILLGFVVTIRVIIDEAVFNSTEIELIAHYKSIGTRLLNLTEGGEGTVGCKANIGKKRPDLSARNMAAKGSIGRPLSYKNRKALLNANIGRSRPDTAKRNLGNKFFLGRKHTDETKKKQSAALSGRVFSVESIEKMRIARLKYWTEKRVDNGQ